MPLPGSRALRGPQGSMWPNISYNLWKNMDEGPRNRSLEISGVHIAPGEEKVVQLGIARLPTGTLIDIPVHMFNAVEPGPVLLVQAGLHGDEINGVETLRRMLQRELFAIERGAVIVVPIVNVFGFIHFSRDLPDGKDVNRSFPGRKTGSLASRIAHAYTQHIVPLVDYGIDLHAGGSQRHNHPQVRYTANDTRSMELAEVFGAPFCFPSKVIAGSFRKVTHKMGVPTLVYEAGASMRFDEGAIKTGIKGIQNVMAYLGMNGTGGENKTSNALQRQQTRWARAPRAGMFVPQVENGQQVIKGQPLGLVTDTYAKSSKKIRAPFDGFVLCINHQAVVNQGDALFHL